LIDSFLEHNKKSWSGWFIRGWALRRLGHFSEAAEAFVRCLELGEQNADIYNELSICTLELGDRQLAKSYLEIALELDAENVKLLSNLAFLHLQDEEFNQVQSLLLRAQVIDPNDPAVKHLQGEMTKRIGTAEEDHIIDG
jgi:Flp pilus assembly protein TadD